MTNHMRRFCDAHTPSYDTIGQSWGKKLYGIFPEILDKHKQHKDHITLIFY